MRQHSDAGGSTTGRVTRGARRLRNRRVALAAAIVFGCGVGTAASDGAQLPIRPGLWDVQSTTTLAFRSLDLPPQQLRLLERLGVPTPDHPVIRTTRTCIGADALDRIQQSGPGRACFGANVRLGRDTLSGDIVCEGQGLNGRGHGTMVFDDGTHFHGAAEADGSSALLPLPSHMTVALQGRWVASNCGNVAPF